MIRHVSFSGGSARCCPAQPISALTIAMVEPTFQALLVSAASSAALLEATNPPTD
jgi:hypothetical protein